MNILTRVLILICTSLLSMAAYSQKVIQNPRFSAISHGYLKIERIILYDTVTVLDFEVSYKPGWWIRVMKDETYIQDSRGGEKLFVKRAEGIELDVKHTTPESGVNRYTLYFPPLDSSVEMIDFMEEQWKIIELELVPREHITFLPETIQGNWLRTDGSNEWVYGFHNDLVICKGEIWPKILVSQNRKNEFVVTLQKQDRLEAIYIKHKRNGDMLIGPARDQLELFSRQLTDRPDFTIPEDEGFQLPVFLEDTAVYKGYLKGYHPKLGTTGMAYVNNVIKGKQESHLISILPDGTFYAEWPMIHPQEVFIRLLGKSYEIYCEPGKTTFQYVSLPDFRSSSFLVKAGEDQMPPSLFMGETARMNQDLMSMEDIGDFHENQVRSRILEMDETEYKEYFLTELEKNVAELDHFLLNHCICKKAEKLKRNKFYIRAVTDILGYRLNKESAYRKKYNIPGDQREIPLEFKSPGPDYYDFIDPDLLNDPVALVSSEYSVVINRLRFTEHVRMTIGQQYRAVLEHIQHKGIGISEDELGVLEKLSMCENYDSARMIFSEDSAIWQPFQKRHSETFTGVISRAYEDYMLKNMEDKFGLGKRLVSDIIQAQARCSNFDRTKRPLTEQEGAEVRNDIGDPFIAEYVLNRNRALKDEIARKLQGNNTSAGYTMNETPKTDADRVFDAIIEKYKGKVVFVDFWATWCSPCRSGMERIKPLKKKLEGEAIEFVYITNQTSPVDTWKLFIPDIDGEHYRVETDQWNLMTSRFNISGIPHYLLVDKNGNVVEEHIYFASSVEQLERLFAKYLNE